MRGSQAYTTARMVGTGLVFALGAIHLASMPEPQERRAGDAVAVVQPSLVQAAFEAAAATGEPVEMPGEGDEYAVRLANPDGTVSTELSSVPVRVRAENGDWERVDYTLRREEGRIVPAAGDQEVSFSPGGNAPMVEFTSAGESLSLGWPYDLPAPELGRVR